MFNLLRRGPQSALPEVQKLIITNP
jgi:hypothetical protein